MFREIVPSRAVLALCMALLPLAACQAGVDDSTQRTAPANDVGFAIDDTDCPNCYALNDTDCPNCCLLAAADIASRGTPIAHGTSRRAFEPRDSKRSPSGDKPHRFIDPKMPKAGCRSCGPNRMWQCC
jgi:hypothetical protein